MAMTRRRSDPTATLKQPIEGQPQRQQARGKSWRQANTATIGGNMESYTMTAWLDGRTTWREGRLY
jgi:hypothetical protein